MAKHIALLGLLALPLALACTPHSPARNQGGPRPTGYNPGAKEASRVNPSLAAGALARPNLPLHDLTHDPAQSPGRIPNPQLQADWSGVNSPSGMGIVDPDRPVSNEAPVEPLNY